VSRFSPGAVWRLASRYVYTLTLDPLAFTGQAIQGNCGLLSQLVGEFGKAFWYCDHPRAGVAIDSTRRIAAADARHGNE
jgi:hypothetical protein